MDVPWVFVERDAASASTGPVDASLVVLAKRGDADAFATLYRRYVDRVYTYVLRRLGDRDLAEDATQVTFLRAVAGLDGCRDESLFAGWLFKIARNVAIDLLRSQRRLVAPLDEVAEVRDPASSPEELALLADDRYRLREARERCLNSSDRELLDLRLQGLNDREIAIVLGRSHGAIRTAQHRLVLKLRGCLDAGGGKG